MHHLWPSDSSPYKERLGILPDLWCRKSPSPNVVQGQGRYHPSRFSKCGFCHVKEPTILSTWRFSQEVITYCFHSENLTKTLIRYHEDFDTHPTLMITFVFHHNWKPRCTQLHILSILSHQMKKTEWNRTLFFFHFEIEEWSTLFSQLCFFEFSCILYTCLIRNCT